MNCTLQLLSRQKVPLVGDHHFLLSFSDWPGENVEMVTSYLEDQLFSLLYLHVFQPNCDLDRQRDEWVGFKGHFVWEYSCDCWPLNSTGCIRRICRDYRRASLPLIPVCRYRRWVMWASCGSHMIHMCPTLQIYHSGCPWMSAQKHLKAMSVFKVYIHSWTNTLNKGHSEQRTHTSQWRTHFEAPKRSLFYYPRTSKERTTSQ